MRVKELIERLGKLPQNAVVVTLRAKYTDEEEEVKPSPKVRADKRVQL